MSNQDMDKVGLKVCGAPDRRIQVSRSSFSMKEGTGN